MSRAFVAVDTNILVYAHNRASEWHPRAAGALAHLANAPAPWAIPWPCVHEFLAVATHPAIFSNPDAVAMAIEQVEIWMESASLRLLGEMQGHWAELKAILAQGRMRGGAIHDGRIAALCREHGITELWTADRDFSRVRGLPTRNPLLAP